MAEWLKSVSGKFKRFSEALTGGKPLEEALPEMLDPGDPRVVIRPLGGDWLCPFTGTRVLAPDWNGSSLTLLKCAAIRDYLLKQPELQKLGSKAQMKSFEDLVQIVVFMRFSAGGAYKYAVQGGEWVCPYCLEKTEILLRNWDGSEADPKWFMPKALEHLKQCAVYQQDPLGGAKTLEDIAEAGGDRARVKKMLATDPRFRLCDANGSWLCPYSARTVASLNLKREPWGPALQSAILDYIMSPDCPGRYSQFNVERSLEELQNAAATRPDIM
ncbi:MAG: hypothetical protein NTW87_28190 [Planctomycetota bacterium]|nr:hypothetical protein [Planctomycetota bacterium]